MAKFERKGKGGQPAINTSSLPDIIFMLLFFFMVSTTMRDTENWVIVKLPEATEIAKLERKDLSCYINIGTPVPSKQAEYGTDARIQLNDSYKTVEEISHFISTERESKSDADKGLMTTVLKIDENIHMGIVDDVKKELRRCSALKIMYSARQAAPVK